MYVFANVQVTISEGLDNPSLQKIVEENLSAFLTEVNDAEKHGRNLNFAILNISDSAQQSLSKLWKISPFICTDEEVIEKCIKSNFGYQVRNIPLLLKPRGKKDYYQEAAISFDEQGKIESVNLCISKKLYETILRDNEGAIDLQNRSIILYQTERLLTSYYTHDAIFINHMLKHTLLNDTNTTKYLRTIQKLFSQNKYISVSFDNVKIQRHLSKGHTGFYGLSLYITSSINNTLENGYLFLLWDLRDKYPMCHICVWQPEIINGHRIQDEEIYSIFDFSIWTLL